MKHGEKGIFGISIWPHGFQASHLTLGGGEKNIEYRKID